MKNTTNNQSKIRNTHIAGSSNASGSVLGLVGNVTDGSDEEVGKLAQQNCHCLADLKGLGFNGSKSLHTNEPTRETGFLPPLRQGELKLIRK